MIGSQSRRVDGQVLPALSRGRHHGHTDGACLMEYVSVLSGSGMFTDHPACTHPALAALAQVVNDNITDDLARARLSRLAPLLIGTYTTDVRVAQTIILVALDAVARAGAPEAEITRRRNRVCARLARWQDQPNARTRASIVASMFSGGWTLNGRHELYSALRLGSRGRRVLPADDRDRWWAELLTDAINSTRVLLRLDPPSPATLGAWEPPALPAASGSCETRRGIPSPV